MNDLPAIIRAIYVAGIVRNQWGGIEHGPDRRAIADECERRGYARPSPRAITDALATCGGAALDGVSERRDS